MDGPRPAPSEWYRPKGRHYWRHRRSKMKVSYLLQPGKTGKPEIFFPHFLRFLGQTTALKLLCNDHVRREAYPMAINSFLRSCNSSVTAKTKNPSFAQRTRGSRLRE